MVKRDRVAGSWLERYSRCYDHCSSASPLKLLGRKQPTWGKARELLHPFSSALLLGKPFSSKNLEVSALWDGKGPSVPCGVPL